MPKAKTRKAQFTVAWPHGQPIRLTLVVPAGRASFVGVLPQVYEIGDAIIARSAEDSTAKGLPPSCSAGCSHCCHQMFYVSQAEAVYLLQALDAMPSAKKRYVLDGFEKNCKALEKNGIFEDVLQMAGAGPVNGQQLRLTTSRYKKQGIPCPFLMRDVCGIYTHRPMICRQYLVTSPSFNCKSSSHAGLAVCLDVPVSLANSILMYDGFEVKRQAHIPLVLLWRLRKQILAQPQPEANAISLIKRFIGFAESYAALQKRESLQKSMGGGSALDVVQGQASGEPAHLARPNARHM